MASTAFFDLIFYVSKIFGNTICILGMLWCTEEKPSEPLIVTVNAVDALTMLSSSSAERVTYIRTGI